MEARLVLEDGSLFQGISKGARGETKGEVVFNTSMTGYQEILTDPSYCGQILTMTFPLIGNYGITEEDFESRRPFLRGFIVHEFCSRPSNWRSIMNVEEYLQQSNIIAMEGIDTRALVRHIREKGAMRGIITTEDTPHKTLLEKVNNSPTISDMDLISQVTTEKPYTWENDGPRIAVIDLGLKLSIANTLHRAGCHVTVLPAHLSAEEIMDFEPAGVVFSNGPGDPRNAAEAIKALQVLVGKLPVLGICLGHQLVALAMGGKTFKLKFGHRGANHPIKDLLKNKNYITSQNHGFSVDAESLPRELSITQQNLNDGTVEGMMNKKARLTTVQYHPEAFPGPLDSNYIFEIFLDQVKGGEPHA